MAVLVSKQAGNLTDANGFYTTLSSQLGGKLVSTVLNTTTFIVGALTFSGSANLKGFVLGFYTPLLNSGAKTMSGVEVCMEQIMGTTTMTIANPCVVTFASHGFVAGQSVRFTTTGALPTGLTTANVIYYARPNDCVTPLNEFWLYSTAAQAIAGGTTGRITTSVTQSGTHTLYAIRQQKFLISADICEGTSPRGTWIIPCEFSGVYAVDNTASKWQLIMRASGAGTGWSYVSSVSDSLTTILHASYTDTTATYTNNTDIIVCKDRMQVTAAATFLGALPSLWTDYSVAGVLCKSTDGFTSEATRAMLVFTNAGAPYTVIFDGSFVTSNHSGIRVGASASPIAIANRITLQTRRNPTAGTTAAMIVGAFGSFADGGAAIKSCGQSIEMYGEVTTNKQVYTTLTAGFSAGATAITVTDASGFVANDYVNMSSTEGSGNSLLILSVVGNTINFTAGLGTAVTSGQYIVRRHNSVNGAYEGIVVTRDNVTTSGGVQGYVQLAAGESWVDIQGVMFYGVSFNLSTTSGFWVDDAIYQNTWNFYMCHQEHSTAESTWATSGFVATLLSGHSLNKLGITFNYCTSTSSGRGNITGGPRGGDTYTWYGLTALGGTITYSNNMYMFPVGMVGTGLGPKYIWINNIFQSSSAGGITMYLSGVNSTMTGNIFIMNGTLGQASNIFVTMNNLINGTITNNTYIKRDQAITISGTIINTKSVNDTFTNVSITDVTLAGYYTDIEFNSPNSVINVDATNQTGMLAGSKFRVTDDNNVVNADYVLEPEGKFVRCGYGLADTTVRTSGTTFGAASAGKFSLRLDSNGNNTLIFTQNIPTGDITGKTMSVNVWAKINDAAYYAGTNTLPILRVNYDNGTIAYAQMGASTAAQLLSIPFSPTTAYGQITVTLECKTDATGTNNRVYFDDFSVQYPAGYALDLGAMDLWANGEPIKPTIATIANVGQVWDELVTSHPTAGTFGAQATQMAVQTDDNQALILTK